LTTPVRFDWLNRRSRWIGGRATFTIDAIDDAHQLADAYDHQGDPSGTLYFGAAIPGTQMITITWIINEAASGSGTGRVQLPTR
jgi:hypothetical protein